MASRVLVGDCRERLRDLPDNSVHCVVTSPPYFGLRDYGTGTWEGGDPACGHVARFARDDQDRIRKVDAASGRRRNALDHDSTSAHPEQYRSVCGKCGAVRIDRQIGLESSVDCGRRQMLRLRPDLTADQREYVVRRLLGAAPASSVSERKP